MFKQCPCLLSPVRCTQGKIKKKKKRKGKTHARAKTERSARKYSYIKLKYIIMCCLITCRPFQYMVCTLLIVVFVHNHEGSSVQFI